jgi:hypothetical protein
MIRRGINKKNFEYWRDEVLAVYNKAPIDFATFSAHRICHKQEIEMLKERIIKLEKKLKK